MLYTDSQDMPVLSSAVASRYYNCCTDGGTSPGNYGYPIVYSERLWETIGELQVASMQQLESPDLYQLYVTDRPVNLPRHETYGSWAAGTPGPERLCPPLPAAGSRSHRV
jgi:hypothetical protein